ncbi:hypothetical protein BR93DRAFT_963880 [Coniochaeta sp. PMI_546]|nr:hypothetical protein BR93DRAFT_963880 [Coniochaeta sp. PMI_546]
MACLSFIASILVLMLVLEVDGSRHMRQKARETMTSSSVSLSSISMSSMSFSNISPSQPSLSFSSISVSQPTLSALTSAASSNSSSASPAPSQSSSGTTSTSSSSASPTQSGQFTTIVTTIIGPSGPSSTSVSQSTQSPNSPSSSAPSSSTVNSLSSTSSAKTSSTSQAQPSQSSTKASSSSAQSSTTAAPSSSSAQSSSSSQPGSSSQTSSSSSKPTTTSSSWSSSAQPTTTSQAQSSQSSSQHGAVFIYRIFDELICPKQFSSLKWLTGDVISVLCFPVECRVIKHDNSTRAVLLEQQPKFCRGDDYHDHYHWFAGLDVVGVVFHVGVDITVADVPDTESEPVPVPNPKPNFKPEPVTKPVSEPKPKPEHNSKSIPVTAASELGRQFVRLRASRTWLYRVHCPWWRWWRPGWIVFGDQQLEFDVEWSARWNTGCPYCGRSADNACYICLEKSHVILTCCSVESDEESDPVEELVRFQSVGVN